MAHLLAAKSLGDIVDEDEWNELIGIPSSTQTITAAADTILADARVIVLNPDADYTMTSTPTIANGTTTGQVLRIICANAEANTITLQDEGTLGSSNLRLTTPLRTITGKEIIVLMFDGTNWVEQGTKEFAQLLISGASPTLTFKNLTAEDIDGGRESTIAIKGIQSGDEETTLVWIRGSHDGVADDQKGKLEFYVNDGSDGDVPTIRMTIFANGNVLMGDAGASTYAYVAPDGGFVMNNTSPEILLWNKTAEDISGGRESEIGFRGRQSGNESSTLARIIASHYGAADDEKGQLEFYVNDGNDGASPTLRSTIDAQGTFTLANGVLALAETTTPSAVGSVGKLYTKADNLFYVQTGDGVEHAVSFDTADYAGIWVNDNAVATTILLVDAYEPVTVFDTDMPEKISSGANANYNITIGGSGDYFVSFVTDITSAGNTKTYEIDVFQIAAATQAITGATQANPCVVTATGHSFSNGNMVKFAGIGGMTELNGQIYTVANAGANDFELNDDNAANINSGAYGAYATPGTAQLATGIGVAHSHHTFGVGVDFGTMGGDGIATLVSGDTLELHVKGITDATNLTFDYVSFHIKRLS